ncbi:hypothetical protein MHYP_G00056560 [Metynnis hypsauchen]
MGCKWATDVIGRTLERERGVRGRESGWWRAFDKSWSLAWSSCVFWERLSRVPCKEDVAEKQCFLPDKGKASLRQDVWAPAGPRIKRARGEGKENLLFVLAGRKHASH